MHAKRLRIIHIISSLDTGGAEMMLLKLLSRMDTHRFSSRVVCLIPPGPVGKKVEDLGIQVEHLGLRRGAFTPWAFFPLALKLSEFKPHIVQTWLYHSDLIGLLAAKATRTGKVVWNIRVSNVEFSLYRRLTEMTVRLCARLSRFADAIITNSHTAKKFHIGLGYRSQRFEVIPNGFDLERFKPDLGARQRVRQELKLSNDRLCVCMVARFHPMKDHRTFLQAARYVLDKGIKAYFILCGDSVTRHNPVLTGWIDELSIGTRVCLLGRRDDVPEIMAAVDVVVLSSRSVEGFPNVIGEAMACGVPCIVTEVGDSARIVDDTGRVVPPKDPDALARAMCEFLELPLEKRLKLGQEARRRIGKYYSLSKVVGDYEKLYLDIATRWSSSIGSKKCDRLTSWISS